MSKAPHLVDPFVRKPSEIPVDRPKTPVRPRNTGIIDGVLPGTGKPEVPKTAAERHPVAPAPKPGQYVDGVVRPSTQLRATQPSAPLSQQPAVPVRQHKPHLQPHPMLQRRPQNAVMDVSPVKRPVGMVQATPSRPGRVHADTRASAQRGEQAGKKRFNFPIKDRASQPAPSVRKRYSTLAVIGIVAGVIFGFFSLFDTRLGYAVIAIYAFIVLFKKLPSRYTFMLVLAMFGGIIITQLIASDSGLSENMAVYAFLLLAVGVLSVGREVWRSERQATTD